MPLADCDFRFLHCSVYARIGRWGTCGDCPVCSRTGMVYPEFCMNTKRYDHLLTLDQLVEQLKRRSM